jgi:RHS repeat-associated protein
LVDEINPDVKIGAVHLKVSNLNTMVAFYQEAIGLPLVERDGGKASLGFQRVLLELLEVPGAHQMQGTTGLYHFAILLPSRKALAQALRHLVEIKANIQGASDHLVSEALYLADPESNGIEIYRDRPRDEWQLSAAGQVRMETVYDDDGKVIAVIENDGTITRTYYDDLDRPQYIVYNLNDWDLQITYPPTLTATGEYHDQNVLTENVYDDDGRLIATIANDGTITRTYYDVLGRAYLVARNLAGQLISVETPPSYNPDYPDQNVLSETVYGPGGYVQKIIDPNGKVTYFCYDGLYRNVKTVINPSVDNPCVDYTPSSEADRDVISINIYDAAGNLLEGRNPNGKLTVYEYDDLGRLITETNTLEKTTGYTYDIFGNRQTMTDANDVTTYYEYNALNRLTAVVENYLPNEEPTNDINVRTEYTYDSVGNRRTIIDAREHITEFGYDALGRQTSENDPLVPATIYGYDDAGNRATIFDSNGYTTTFSYDGLSRLVSIDYPAPDADVEFTYDISGNRDTMSDGLGTTVWGYDDLSRPLTITQPTSGTVYYRYDAAGNRQILIYPDGKQVAYDYDLMGRMQRVTDWDTRVITYTYDKAGQLLETSLPEGLKSTFDYDDAGQLTNITHTHDGLRISSYEYLYNPVGNRSVVTETTYSLSQVNLAVVMSGGEGEGMQAMAMPEAYPPPQGENLEAAPLPQVESAYPAPLEALPEMEEQETPLTPTEPSAYPTGIRSYPPPTSSGTSWLDKLKGFFNRLSHGDTSLFAWSSPASVSAREAEVQLRSAEGEPEQMVIVYDYDPLNRLTAAVYSDGTYFQYQYDAVGNRQVMTTTGEIITNYFYDEANRLTNVGEITYTWDNNGNLLSDGVFTYSYDHANQLVGVSGAGVTASYAYNGLIDRLQETVNDVTTSFTMDMESGLTQALSDGSYTYMYGRGRIAQHGSGGAEYFLGDALGSVRQMVNGEGEVILTKEYEPYGKGLNSSGSGETSYGFTGEYLSSQDLIYLRARWYLPNIGRFITRDKWGGIPLRPLSYNRWLYGYDSPIVHIDPTGQSPHLCIPLIGCVDTAKNAVTAAKLAYSRVGPVVLAIAQNARGGNVWRNRFNCLSSVWSKPNTAIELLGDYLCERGPEHVKFSGSDMLTKELAQSVLLDHVRKEFYGNPNTQYPVERQFNRGEFILALLDSLVAGSIDNPDFPVTHFLGSFDYSVVNTGSNRTRIVITNRTDLASGTHIPGRFPPEDERENPLSVEQFITENPELENENILGLLTDNPGIVSILEPMEREKTQFWMGGGNMLQTFTWSENSLGCWIQKLPWPVYLPFLDIR